MDKAIIATGLSRPRYPSGTAATVIGNERILSFQDFMARADQMFPLRGFKRVAVIGGGNSAMNAIEFLTGQGPKTSIAAVDYPDVIDWYGAPASTRGEWEKNCRSRYKGIARLLPTDPSQQKPEKVQRRSSRVNPITGPAKPLSYGYKLAYVGEEGYDYVIVCCGFQQGNGVTAGSFTQFVLGARAVATQRGGMFAVGPAAGLVLNESELYLADIPEAAVSMFRYAPRTAALASTLALIL